MSPRCAGDDSLPRAPGTGEVGRRPCVDRGAFSLLELLLAMAIIAVMAAVAVPRYGAATIRYQADLAAHRIVSDLELARSTAKAGSSALKVDFRPSQDSYVLEGATPLDPHLSEYTVNLKDKPYGATLISADFGGDSAVQFNGWGLPDSGGTATLSVGTEQRAIVVDAETGKASIQ